MACMTKTSHIHPHAWRVLIGSPPAARATFRAADRAFRIAAAPGPHFLADAIDPAMDAWKKARHPTP